MSRSTNSASRFMLPLIALCLATPQPSLRAEIIVNTLPANNQANLGADVAQTFTTGILTDFTLSRIVIEGPQVPGAGTAPLGPFVLELWTDTDGDHATWDPGTLIASSTPGTLIAGGATRTPFDFPTLPALSNNTVYGFTFTDGSGTRVAARPGLTNASAITNGTLFHLGAPVFSDAYDIAMQIITGGPLGSLEVVVDRDTGNISFHNTTPQSLTGIISYSLLSEAGGLNPAAWNKLADGGGLINNNDDWTLLDDSSVELAEAVLVTSGSGDGGDVAASSGTWNLGNVWRPSPIEDLAMEILLDDGTILLSSRDFQIVYTGNDDSPIGVGDLAGATVNTAPNGTIDLVDWQKFKSVYGNDVSGLTAVDAYLNGDLNVDGVSNMSDFILFRDLYNAANGPEAFALVLSGSTVPEPGTWLLALCGGVLAVAVRWTSHARVRPATIGVLASLAMFVALASSASAQVPVVVFGDDFQSYPVGDPADFSATGNWTHNGNGTGANASRIFNTVNFGGERLWISSGANAAAGSGLNSRGLTLADGIESQTEYLVSAAIVTETFNGVRTATGTYDLLKGVSFGTATSLIGGPQPFLARGDDVDGVVPNDSNSYDDQRTTHLFNTGAMAPGDQLFISIAFNGTNDGAFVGIDDVMIIDYAMPGARVNLNTGSVTLVGDAKFDFDIISYSLTSATGQLLPGNFTSLESQHIGDPSQTPDDGVGFEVLGTPSSTEIAEGQLLSSTIFSNSTSLSLGNIFDTSTLEQERDLILTLTTTTGQQLNAVVEYVLPSSLPGDYNGDGMVDAADYTVWRNNLGAADESALNFNGDGGGVSISDYQFWKDRFGNSMEGSLVGPATAIPEPASLALLAAVGLLATRLRWTRGKCRMVPAVLVASLLALTSTALAVHVDRQYDLGDDPAESSAAGAFVGTATYDSAGTPGAGDLQDLQVAGSPAYISVSNRPGAEPTDLGVVFNGISDALHTGISMNAPAQMWNNATFFPGPPPNIFPHNYAGIFTHGIQLWAKPNVAALGNGVQTLVADTTEHGVGITAEGNWELLYDDLRFDTGVPVISTLDSNGWVHLMEITSPAGGAWGGTLLINGVAVLASPTFYDPDSAPLVIGAEPDGQGGFINHYDGVLDDVKLFLWGDNSNQLGQDNAVGGINSGGGTEPITLNADGRDWGGLDMGNTNEWIVNQLAAMNITDPGDVDLSGGPADETDAALFVTYWRQRQIINGVQVGDWNSRQQGDLNFDGVVDMRDLLILHESLTASGAGGFNFALFNQASVPEPASVLLVLGALASGAVWIRRTGR